MDDNRHSTKRLTKNPPGSVMPSSRSLRSQSSAANLGRNPSTSKAPNPQRSNSINTSSQPPSLPPSLSLSPNLTSADFQSTQPYTPYGFTGRDNSNDSVDRSRALEKSPLLSSHPSLRRPGPPPLSHTSPDPRMLTPSLRQSASFTSGDHNSDPLPPPRSDSGFGVLKRHSDESNTASTSSRARWRKKSGISGFMNSVLGSPRNMKISAPENPVHLTHVGYDSETGQFTVCSTIRMLLFVFSAP